MTAACMRRVLENRGKPCPASNRLARDYSADRIEQPLFLPIKGERITIVNAAGKAFAHDLAGIPSVEELRASRRSTKTSTGERRAAERKMSAADWILDYLGEQGGSAGGQTMQNAAIDAGYGKTKHCESRKALVESGKIVADPIPGARGQSFMYSLSGSIPQ